MSKTYTAKELQKTLSLHEKWLRSDKCGVRANLSGANLSGADLSRAKGFHAEAHQIVPETGAFIAWKKLQSGSIAQLLIHEDAECTGGIASRKCRVSKAKVLSIVDAHGKKVKSGKSLYDSNVIYRVGKTVTPDFYDPNPFIDCSNGIHCFISKGEAERYIL